MGPPALPFADALLRGIAVLVTACPGALGLATPLVSMQPAVVQVTGSVPTLAG